MSSLYPFTSLRQDGTEATSNKNNPLPPQQAPPWGSRAALGILATVPRWVGVGQALVLTCSGGHTEPQRRGPEQELDGEGHSGTQFSGHRLGRAISSHRKEECGDPRGQP